MSKYFLGKIFPQIIILSLTVFVKIKERDKDKNQRKEKGWQDPNYGNNEGVQ